MTNLVLPHQIGQSPWQKLSKYKDVRFLDNHYIKNNYDYIIVGAGFGGVSAALELAKRQSEKSILLVDALSIGENSSGRNAGFFSVAQIAKALIGRQKFTLEDQKWLLRLNQKALDIVLSQIKEHKLDIYFDKEGMYKAVREERNQKALDLLASYFDKLDVKYEYVAKDDLASRLGTNFYNKALYLDETYLNNPAELIRALATVLPKNVFIYENTPVIKINDGLVPSIELNDGRVIKGSKIIVLNNAFLKCFYPKQAKNLTAIHSFGAMTDVLDDEILGNLAKVKPWGITATHPAGATIRFTRDKRIFVRTDIAYASSLNTSQQRALRAYKLLNHAFYARFPQLKDIKLKDLYGGLIAFTGNTLPIFGKMADNVYAASTSDGSGVTRAIIVGTYLAHLILGIDSAELNYIKQNYKASYLPPEPFRAIGANATIAYRNFEAGSEL